MDSLTIREMQPADLEFAVQLALAEGWHSASRLSFQLFYEYDPHGCLLAELDGRPAGVCIATSYGRSGFVGEVIVRPDLRGQGCGARLLLAGMQYLRQGGAQTLYLDGVVKAVPLYERHGFRKLCRSVRFGGRLPGASHPQVRRLTPADLPQVYALDQAAFGADRSFYLRRRMELLPECSLGYEAGGRLSGFILARPAEGMLSVGPWVADEGTADPLALLRGLALASDGRELRVGVLDSHRAALAALRCTDLQEQADPPWRMAAGEEPPLHVGFSPACWGVGAGAKG
jgi:predicted N-acetyltransferase YhbS